MISSHKKLIYMNPKIMNAQQGMGLVEVLIALLVLSIGVMGFSMMQINATRSSNDAMSRTKAISLSQDLAERIRNNSVALTSLQAYKTALSGQSTDPVNCVTSICTDVEQAKKDAVFMITEAKKEALTINLADCPKENNEQSRNCIYVGWGNTKDAIKEKKFTECIHNNGIFVQDSQCIVTEVF